MPTDVAMIVVGSILAIAGCIGVAWAERRDSAPDRDPRVAISAIAGLVGTLTGAVGAIMWIWGI